MKWLRAKRQELAKDFVEDAKEEVIRQIPKVDYKAILPIIPIAIYILSSAISQSTLTKTVTSKPPVINNFRLYIGTINISSSKGGK